MTELDDPADSFLPEDWFGDDATEYTPRKRPFVTIVALIVVVGLAALPLYSLFDGRNPPLADNGLEICGFDYCQVVEAVGRSGLDLEMARLANQILPESEARALADELTAYLGIEPVTLSVVDRLGGRLGGIYDPATRSIIIERPANAWVVAHEVAHAVAAGHGQDFTTTLIDLADWLGND